MTNWLYCDMFLFLFTGNEGHRFHNGWRIGGDLVVLISCTLSQPPHCLVLRHFPKVGLSFTHNYLNFAIQTFFLSMEVICLTVVYRKRISGIKFDITLFSVVKWFNSYLDKLCSVFRDILHKKNSSIFHKKIHLYLRCESITLSILMGSSLAEI